MARDELPFPVFTGAVDRGEIERISARDVTPEEFAERYIKKGMAVVLTDVMEAWPLFAPAPALPNALLILSCRRLLSLAPSVACVLVFCFKVLKKACIWIL